MVVHACIRIGLCTGERMENSMGVNLSELFQKEQYHSEVRAGSVSEAEVVNGKYAGNGGEKLQLQPGQQFQGTVIGTEGDRVSIRTQDNLVFSAKIENGVNIQNGAVLNFEVKGIQGNQIALTPLYSNLSQDSSIIRALQAAELPVTENSIQMVNEMMSQGMGIYKQSLQDMFHLLGQYDTADPASLVQMKQMQLPITTESIIQFENFKSNTAQILNGYQEIGEQMLTVFHDMAKQQDYEGLGKLFTEVMKAVMGEQLSDLPKEEGTGAVLPGTDAEDAGTASQAQSQGSAGEVQAEQPGAGTADGGQNGKIPESADPASAAADQSGQGAKLSVDQVRLQAADSQLLQFGGDSQNDIVTGKGNDGRNSVAMEVFMNALRQAGERERSGHTPEQGKQSEPVLSELSQETVPEAQAEMVGERKLQEFVRTFLSKLSDIPEGERYPVYEEAGKTLSGLLRDSRFENAFRNAITKEWLLKPQDVSGKENVKALYEKVLRQTASLEQVFAEAGKSDCAAMKGLCNMTKNVKFLNELSQNFSYVQLPLKMSEHKAHGDLYVYTNKRNFASGSGAVTALLHLAMEHLGNMDIYVAMQNHKVNTKFYLENEELIDFLEGHMEELDKRLAAKGYAMHSELLPQDHKDIGNVFDEMLKDSHGIGKAPMVRVSRQSFDARA